MHQVHPASGSAALEPNFEQVQAHYDLPDQLFSLFLDESRTYSCAKFDTPTTSLADAQIAKMDLALGKCELTPGQLLLDIGSGWGASARRANEKYGARVIGLTLSRNQHAYSSQLSAGNTDIDFRLQGWETFAQKVDRIVSIGAFEHFGRAKYDAFFGKCRDLLPHDGVMLLHTITKGRITDDPAWIEFDEWVRQIIFPGGEAPAPEWVMQSARQGGFEVVHVESLRPHYARTLDCWAANFQGNRQIAVESLGLETYELFHRFLTDSAHQFRIGTLNLHQFKMRIA